MEEIPIRPTTGQSIEREMKWRATYANYKRAVEKYGMASREQFEEARRVRDLGILPSDIATYMVFMAFVQWFCKAHAPDDWSSSEQTIAALEAEGEEDLANLWAGMGQSEEEIISNMKTIWGPAEAWVKAQSDTESLN